MKKIDKYEKALVNFDLIFSGELELSVQAKMSLIAALLHMEFSHWTFCGFYVIKSSKMLEIGPYQGNILPCTHILVGNGVCGTSVKKKKTIIVDDVREHDNYISCDSNTLSEIVVPIYMKNKIVAVLDIDSPIIGDFDRIDKNYLEKISSFL
tara:strand:+ start:188 stop:643 length:456 start_codon:yes stop_codon:yes gene_type:complete